jgi:hypothetical protein
MSWLLPALAGACVATVVLVIIAKQILVAFGRLLSSWIDQAQ